MTFSINQNIPISIDLSAHHLPDGVEPHALRDERIVQCLAFTVDTESLSPGQSLDFFTGFHPPRLTHHG
ncbi:hypothetical protein ACNKHO_06900 [Shigella flexneri]